MYKNVTIFFKFIIVKYSSEKVDKHYIPTTDFKSYNLEKYVMENGYPLDNIARIYLVISIASFITYIIFKIKSGF